MYPLQILAIQVAIHNSDIYLMLSCRYLVQIQAIYLPNKAITLLLDSDIFSNPIMQYTMAGIGHYKKSNRIMQCRILQNTVSLFFRLRNNVFGENATLKPERLTPNQGCAKLNPKLLVTFQAFFPEQIAFLKMEVEQRLRGRIVRKPKEQVWMLKTDSVRNTNTQIH